MGYHLYCGQESWVLVPDCLRASRAAEAAHGPLRFVGSPGLGMLSFEELSCIGRQFDARSYALIDADLAARLVQGFVREPPPMPSRA